MVTISEGDAVIVSVEELAVGDGAAAKVSTEILDDAEGVGIALHDLNVPWDATESVEQRAEISGRAVVG
jgi:hypothetical protein